jgi:hypothetical protein
MTHKFKNINISSNGSIFFSYNTFNNIKILNFLEKDDKNFSYNAKNKNLKSTLKSFFNYKNKYLKNK